MPMIVVSSCCMVSAFGKQRAGVSGEEVERREVSDGEQIVDASG